MGNCSLKGVATASTATAAKGPNSIRVMTDSGDIIEYEGPKLAGEVLGSQFPGYGIFQQGRLWLPLLDHEELHRGQFYYLLPLKEPVREAEPVRMSTSSTAAVEVVHNLKKGSGVEVLPPPQKGVWRVKLVIDTKQLEEILSEEVNTEALIEQMRLAASSAASVPPKRTKIVSWGQWGGLINWKPILGNVFKVPRSSDLCTGNPCQGKAANELILAS